MNRKLLRRPIWAGVIASLAAMLMVVPSSAGSTSQPTLTEAQIESLVAASSGIQVANKAVLSKLPTINLDFKSLPKPGSQTCRTATDCVDGDTKSKKVVVLLGDSHTNMWLPAIAPAARAAKVKVVVLWLGRCPAAAIAPYFPQFGLPAACSNFRSAALRVIAKIHPISVILAEKTTQVPTGPGQYSTSAEWTAGLEATINSLKMLKTKVVTIEDTPYFPVLVPQCLSLRTQAIQQCAVSMTTAPNPGFQSAEQTAASATGTGFIPTLQWFCTSTCSPVIGDTIVYLDTTHISRTYAMELSGVMGLALKRYL